MKTIENDHSDLTERLSLHSRHASGSEIDMKILILKRVFFGGTLLGSMIVYLWAFLPQL